MLRNSLSWFELLWSWGPLAAAMLLNALPALRKSRNPQLAVARKASAGCALWLLLAGAGLIGLTRFVRQGGLIQTGAIVLWGGLVAGGIGITAAVCSARKWQQKNFPAEKPQSLTVATIMAMLVTALAWVTMWMAYQMWFGRTY